MNNECECATPKCYHNNKYVRYGKIMDYDPNVRKNNVSVQQNINRFALAIKVGAQTTKSFLDFQMD